MQNERQRSRPEWLKPAFGWTVVLALAVAAGRYARLPMPVGQAGAGRVFPRVPSSPDLPTLLWMLGVGSVVWYAVFLALPLFLWIARRVDGLSRSRAFTVASVVIGIATLVVLTSWVDFTITYRGAPSRPDFSDYLPQALRQNLLPWIALTGIVVAVESRRRAVNLAVEQERLRSGMAAQRLVALTSQLQPHFLFNTLQGISTLIHRDPDAADEMLGKLADLLRDVLRDRDRVVVPLSDEITYARTYLEIAKLRFGDRLRYEIDVPRDLEEASVPLFILQPLVENAIAHGIGSKIEGGSVRVRAYREYAAIRLEVEDDGAGVRTGNETKEGIGMSNTRERLRAAFGNDQSFELLSVPGGTIARVEIPADRSTGVASA